MTSKGALGANEVRTTFLDYFARNGHEIVPSAPLVPLNDPTLMFVNAGMVPFKNVFTGEETRPYQTAASSQKCVRAGGKHNDLDNVGYTARHHTFFEMLGNFSFGDYFKEQAIVSAWELLTGEYGISGDRLTVTVYHEDDEAFDLWRRVSGLPEDRIIRIATNDNFWSMGDTGPCGPCSEIFYDHGDHIPGGPPGSADEDGDRFVEIWNLVFMQYEQTGPGARADLPKPSIDTGMGLERITAVMQGTHDNYLTNTMRALVLASAAETGVAPDGDQQASHRVIADHLRATSFLIADGVLPGNEGRGYVVRRIMRRAMRHAHMLGAKELLLHKLVPTLIAEMGSAYPELGRAEALVTETLKLEEARFKQMLDRGLKLLQDEVAKVPAGGSLAGEVAFKLYDTYGFPLDLTEDALREQGRVVDTAGFNVAMDKQRAAARAAWAGSGDAATDKIWFDIKDENGATDFLGYDREDGEAVVQAIVVNGLTVDKAGAGDKVSIVTNQTPFYGESGGQMGDAGILTGPDGLIIRVADTQKKLGSLHVHMGDVEGGTLSTGDALGLHVDAERRAALRANHSVTHVLHEVLRRTLGDHVTQKGSLVAPDRLRFDISHPKAVTSGELDEVEAGVNALIRSNGTVETRIMDPDSAVEAGALALFGEKYGDEVRVVSMGHDQSLRHGNFSVELCGGTHVKRLGDIGAFRIIAEGAVASGVRRIEALTGEAARRFDRAQEGQLMAAVEALRTTAADLPARVESLLKDRKKLERDLAEARKALAMGGSGDGGPAIENVNGISYLAQVLDGVSPKDLRGLADEAKKKVGSGVVVLVAVNDGKAAVLVGVTDDLLGTLSAVDLVRVGAAAVGGKGGGGRPDMAQAGGPDGAKADEAVQAIRTLIAGG